MKTNFQKYLGLALALGVGCGTQVSSADTGYVNFIEMVEIGDDGQGDLIWQMPNFVPDQGVASGDPVPENGAFFLLSTVKVTFPLLYWPLDQVAVGGYLPRVEMTVETHDQESEVIRTRADQPMRLKVKVEGLYETGTPGVDESSIQDAARQVQLQVFSQDYPSGSNSLPGGVITNDAHSNYTLLGNGEFPATPGDFDFYTTLNPDRPDKARGEEHFVVRSLADYGVIESVIEQTGVQVWPVWSCSMTGLDQPTFIPYQYSGPENEKFAREQEVVVPEKDYTGSPDAITYEVGPPEITFSWEDLYPSSTVGVIVNSASKPYPWGGSWVGGTKRVFNENASLDYELVVSDWGNVFSGPGRYAIWIVVHTPGIGWEVGGQFDSAGNLQPGGWVVPIARPTIKFRGGVHTIAN